MYRRLINTNVPYCVLVPGTVGISIVVISVIGCFLSSEPSKNTIYRTHILIIFGSNTTTDHEQLYHTLDGNFMVQSDSCKYTDDAILSDYTYVSCVVVSLEFAMKTISRGARGFPLSESNNIYNIILLVIVK
jgi:hypothetical protein